MALTQERLKELLNYSPETGLFYWREDRGGRKAKSKHLGHFATKEEAHAAYVAAAQNIFGEFARAA